MKNKNYLRFIPLYILSMAFVPAIASLKSEYAPHGILGIFLGVVLTMLTVDGYRTKPESETIALRRYTFAVGLFAPYFVTSLVFPLFSTWVWFSLLEVIVFYLLCLCFSYFESYVYGREQKSHTEFKNHMNAIVIPSFLRAHFLIIYEQIVAGKSYTFADAFLHSDGSECKLIHDGNKTFKQNVAVCYRDLYEYLQTTITPYEFRKIYYETLFSQITWNLVFSKLSDGPRKVTELASHEVNIYRGFILRKVEEKNFDNFMSSVVYASPHLDKESKVPIFGCVQELRQVITDVIRARYKETSDNIIVTDISSNGNTWVKIFAHFK